MGTTTAGGIAFRMVSFQIKAKVEKRGCSRMVQADVNTSMVYLQT